MQNRVIWTASAAVLALILVGGLAWAQDDAGGPRAVAVEPIHDVGVVPKGEDVKHEFVIRNDGDETLKITDVKPACGCTVADYDRAIDPGATGIVSAVVNTKEFRGPIQKSIKVFTNDPKAPSIVLVIKANIKPQIEIQPGYARFIVVQGEAADSSEQKVWASEGESFQILEAKSPYPHVKVDYAPADEEGKWTVTISLANDAPVGPMADHVRLETDHPKHKIIQIPISGYVRPLLAVTPQVADFGRRDLTEPYEAKLEVKNLGSGEIALTSAATDLKGVDAEIEELEKGRLYNIVLTLNPGMEPGRFRGKVTIQTSSREQPVVEVDLTGTVVGGSDETGR